MNYYPNLLASAFATLSSESSPRVLSLISSDNGMDAGDPPSGRERVEFPASSPPTGTDHQCLPGGEAFVTNALSAVSNSTANCVFVFPPLMNDMRLSEEWRERFGRMGIAEALAESLIGHSGSANGLVVLAMLVPAHFVGSSRSSAWRQEFFPTHSAVVIEHDHADVPQALGLPIHAAV